VTVSRIGAWMRTGQLKTKERKDNRNIVADSGVRAVGGASREKVLKGCSVWRYWGFVVGTVVESKQEQDYKKRVTTLGEQEGESVKKIKTVESCGDFSMEQKPLT